MKHQPFRKFLFFVFCSICFNLILSKDLLSQSTLDTFLGAKDKYSNIKVIKVISADTIELENSDKIKLIGLKAPDAPEHKEEVKRDKNLQLIEPELSPILTIEEEAFNFTKNLLEGKVVRLEFDVERKDDSFYSYAYVFLRENNLFVNAEIIRQGFAHLQIRPPNNKYADLLREAYREAKIQKRGLQND
ncbi:thermonuclease [sediment metagenome]|uniref:Thermonuclease n=1 Tax=sediment metagenome TaxID=749907 RepID=D9PEZ5_9ZZZZ